MVDPETGIIAPQWWFVFQRLVARTGGQQGAQYMPISGGTFTGPVKMLANPLSGSDVVITGGSIDATGVGATTPAAGSFTSLSASGTVSGAGFVTLLAPYATLASPALTGTPTMPTAAPGTNTTQGATTAFVQSAIGGFGSGTVTSLATGTGLTGGTITTTGTISLAPISSHNLLANTTAGSAAPLDTTLTALIDAAIGSTQGDILYRNGASWVVLPPGTSGQYLATGGPAANPSWTSVGSFTTVAATSTITPNSVAGVVGTTTNDNAQAGSIGEFVSSTVLVGSAVSLTTNITANVTSISLGAGDWDVSGNVVTHAAGSTVTSFVFSAISTTSATLPTAPGAGAYALVYVPSTAGAFVALPTGTTRLSLSGTTTVYLLANSAFNTSTSAAYGFIGARRVR